MPQFRLVINLGNDEINPKDIINAMLTACAEINDFVRGNSASRISGDIRDINGNVVGHYEVV